MKSISELSTEVKGVAMIVEGLSLQFDEKDNTRLDAGAMNTAMFGIYNYLERIAADLDILELELHQGGGNA